MAREIKFRAWLPGINKMTHAHSLEELMNWNTKPEDNGTAIWLQYTGVKDKNGKEIYEGDICNVHTGHAALKADFGVNAYFVRWRETGSSFDLIPTANPEHKVGYTFDNGGVYSVEIIGNIYERETK